MVRSRLRLGAFALALSGLWGCGPSTPPVEVQPQGGLDRAKGLLNDYAQGMPLGSEVMTFPEIVEAVRQADPRKAAILEKGLADLKRSPDGPRAKALELLKQL